jgi:hypothetical protein
MMPLAVSISDATIWVSLLMMLAKARIVNYDRNCSFIVLATVITIVNYDHHLFIVQATGNKEKLLEITNSSVLVFHLFANIC